MSAEQFRSSGDLFQAIKESAGLGRKRSYLDDSKKLLELKKAEWENHYLQDCIPDLPTLIVANHYSRTPLMRIGDSFMTTNDSLVLSAVITQGIPKLSPRRTTWLTKGNLSGPLSRFSGARKAQEAAIACYDLIDVDNKSSREIYESLQEAISEGLNIGIYPQGRIGRVLKKPRRGIIGFREKTEFTGFRAVISLLSRTGLPFQIMPVSVFQQSGKYQAIFGEVLIPAGKAKDLTEEAMRRIALSLPRKLQGDYRK
ncbi:MAG: hypothetical protein A3H50_01510 [Candidatus Levybacteria bacterium RIFCSPLOWO2_02_FULL_37_10]|nr:MAG: hypothetical protein A2860_03220 [Candidatus Levybacteria bacterium RIFCSPHIGHO2_01_FULL_37_33]OGH16908.1 MAG: hypothetical protein A3C97_00110 [Candidatus Levybacteria bacterium RIFCSPHIGHO2_02_FULL_37_11]OGH29876.1 MAG: hypothetical protein A3F30_01655 [Candidatus Levybacteria bacterium RIFCSPHIGHO2_12_FULL_37_12]OGH32982.1 MAG: hypothetical protein A2953_01015 [Candidatus Levybacteria bacterium RIFCSPLOWO2_01_FULL_36_54]OGH43346.1 MAG: hypothetical protein A3H50_01510 [Candidatus Lev